MKNHKITATLFFLCILFSCDKADLLRNNPLDPKSKNAAPLLTTAAATNIDTKTATLGGTITSQGSSAVKARGVCWSTNINPTIANSKTSDGTGTGTFVSNLTGLTPNTKYFVRAYATNNGGTGYGSSITINTLVETPTPVVTTNTVTLIGVTTAICGGNITSAGISSVTSKGVCWSTAVNPTIALTTKTNEGTGIGTFTSNLAGLTAGTLYHVRAYATNINGTSYGSDVTFTTLTSAVVPTLTTSVATGIAMTTATGGGFITFDGGADVTERGVCWSTALNPTIALTTKTSDGTGTGTFTSNITGLTGGTIYHIRAFATNSAGTAYGSDLTFTTGTTASVPTVTTTTVGSITSTTAIGGGNVTSNGGASVSSRGICWSLTTGPTIALSTKTNDGSGIGGFTSNITGLTLSTKYYVRAYATNSAGTAYGTEVSFTTSAVTILLPTVATTAASAITINTATSGGNITNNGGDNISDAGVCWSTAANPTIALSSKTTLNATGTGIFTSSITGLIASTTYHIRAYATNSAGTAYGSDLTFITLAANFPTITTNAISLNAGITATSGGNITSDGGASVTVRGVCWGSTLNPTISNRKTSDATGSGVFVSNLTGLSIDSTYHVRAYATNSAGTAYGQDIAFTTPTVPTVTTTAITSVTQTSAYSGGNVTLDGRASVTQRGVCWGTAADPTIVLSTKISDASGGTGIFTSNITGLDVNTTYYIRAYATNSAGTAYGANVTFSTSAAAIPTITTTAITANLGTTATSGGNIVSDGAAAVTVRGVCWGSALNPTIADSKTSDGTGSGIFVSNLIGLTIGTSYHVRAYATNSAGIAYGQDIAFTTANISTITTSAITSITQTSATSGGNITLNGGASVTNRGICWSTTSNPTIDLTTKTSDGAGNGTFTSNMTGLTVSTTYFVRAYATNSAGTAYGSNVSFTTSGPIIPTLTTSDLTAVTLTTATSGGNISADGFATITAKGVVWNTATGPTVALTTKTSDASGGTGIFTSNITGLTANTVYYVRAYATNSAGTAYGNEYILKTATGTLTDIDGNTYYTVTIGAQEWMRDNLKTTKYRDNNNIANITDNTTWNTLTAGAYCWYNNDITNKATYGALYNWYTTTDSRFLCPTGWHVPTDAEWTTMTTSLGGLNVAGGKLKETGTSHWNYWYTLATNETGFTTLPGGYRNADGSFYDNANTGYWWSATEYSVANAWYRSMIYYNNAVVSTNISKLDGYSVRCLKD